MRAIHVLPTSNGQWLVKDAAGRDLSHHKKRKAAERIARKEAARRNAELFIFNDLNELERRSRPHRGLFGRTIDKTKPA